MSHETLREPAFQRALKRKVHRVIARTVATILRTGAVYDPDNFQLWETRGYHVTPLHFYSPIPDTRKLSARLGRRPSECVGLDFRAGDQLALLESFEPFSKEFSRFTESTPDGAFQLDNDAFVGIDPYVYYCMIRRFGPKRVLEIGSGHSTLVAASAVERNGDSARLTVVDPWPRPFIASGVDRALLIRRPVQDVPLDTFTSLADGDMLFIDTSHVVRMDGEVNFLVLEVLPRLAPGVLVHFHDIFLPDDYPAEWLTDNLRFWTEQYLLQAYLCENPAVEIVFASNYMAKLHSRAVRHYFSGALDWSGCSFWLRRTRVS